MGQAVQAQGKTKHTKITNETTTGLASIGQASQKDTRNQIADIDLHAKATVLQDIFAT
jgi:hypothetical protein